MEAPASSPQSGGQSAGRAIGRYVLFDEIASGGMATVHLGRLQGPVGFSRTVAIKRLHAQFAKDADFVSMFLDEARLVGRIRHPNVVPTLDVVDEGGEILLVMEYVQGEVLSKLVRKAAASKQVLPLPVVAAILSNVLHGLHAAHEAKGEKGEALGIVHRDVSPQNVLVGIDGVARLLDFGVAKATQRSQSTRSGQVKGKLAYMAPEQISADAIDRRADIFAAGVVLWEALTSTRLFVGPTDARVMAKVIAADVRPPSEVRGDLPEAFDAICLRALSREPGDRFSTAREMALAIEKASLLAPASEVGTWVESLAQDAIVSRATRVNEIESRSNVFAKLEPPTPVEPTSQVTAKRSLLVPILIGIAVLAAIGIAVALGRSTRPIPATAASAEPSTTASTPVSVPVAPATTSAQEQPVATAASSAARTATPKPVKPVATAKPKSPCADPFIIDANGIKHAKPECM